MKIIDAHTHPRFSTPWEDSNIMEYSSMAPEEVVRQSRGAKIEKMVVLGNILRFGPNPKPEQVRLINEETADLVKAFPDFFIGYCYLNPNHSAEVLEREASLFIREKGFRAIKLEVDMCASDPAMGTLMEIAEAFQIPVLQHAWEIRNREKEDTRGKKNSSGRDVAVLASRHPRVRIQMAHLTGVGIAGVEAIRPCENVWVDTSGALPMAEMTEYAVNRLGEDRIIYGSDFPIRDLSGQLSKVYSAKIPDAVKEKIFYRNLMGLWNEI